MMKKLFCFAVAILCASTYAGLFDSIKDVGKDMIDAVGETADSVVKVVTNNASVAESPSIYTNQDRADTESKDKVTDVVQQPIERSNENAVQRNTKIDNKRRNVQTVQEKPQVVSRRGRRGARPEEKVEANVGTTVRHNEKMMTNSRDQDESESGSDLNKNTEDTGALKTDDKTIAQSEVLRYFKDNFVTVVSRYREQMAEMSNDQKYKCDGESFVCSEYRVFLYESRLECRRDELYRIKAGELGMSCGYQFDIPIKKKNFEEWKSKIEKYIGRKNEELERARRKFEISRYLEKFVMDEVDEWVCYANSCSKAFDGTLWKDTYGLYMNDYSKRKHELQTLVIEKLVEDGKIVGKQAEDLLSGKCHYSTIKDDLKREYERIVGRPWDVPVSINYRMEEEGSFYTGDDLRDVRTGEIIPKGVTNRMDIWKQSIKNWMTQEDRIMREILLYDGEGVRRVAKLHGKEVSADTPITNIARKVYYDISIGDTVADVFAKMKKICGKSPNDHYEWGWQRDNGPREGKEFQGYISGKRMYAMTDKHLLVFDFGSFAPGQSSVLAEMQLIFKGDDRPADEMVAKYSSWPNAKISKHKKERGMEWKGDDISQYMKNVHKYLNDKFKGEADAIQGKHAQLMFNEWTTIESDGLVVSVYPDGNQCMMFSDGVLNDELVKRYTELKAKQEAESEKKAAAKKAKEDSAEIGF